MVWKRAEESITHQCCLNASGKLSHPAICRLHGGASQSGTLDTCVLETNEEQESAVLGDLRSFSGGYVEKVVQVGVMGGV